jgi:hypothetical protein
MRLVERDRVGNAVSIGTSTKADVVAALGETLVIRFDTGYEIWGYRLADDARTTTASRHAARSDSEKSAAGQSTEFVLLFAPSGVVTKTRIRPAPQPSRER